MSVPRSDDSMALLRGLAPDAMDDSYAAAARDPSRTKGFAGRGSLLVAGLVLLGLLLTVAVLQTRSSAPQVAEEQQQLVDRVRSETAQNDRLQARAATLQGQVNRLQDRLLNGTGSGAELRDRITALAVLAGTGRVQGPGLRIVVDDAPPATGQRSGGAGGTGDANGTGATGPSGGSAADDPGRILDIDLQQLVNGLWSAGAEAIAVNGQRLTAMTAIRSADRSITVDYRPLARPYVVTAIGDPKTLQAKLIESPGGQWMLNLRGGHGVRFDIRSKGSLTLPADSGAQVRHARAGSGREATR